MSRRIAIMDALDAAGADLVLKDEDFRFLVECLKAFPYTIAHKDVLAIIDGVIGSEDAPAPFAPAPLKPEANGRVHP